MSERQGGRRGQLRNPVMTLAIILGGMGVLGMMSGRRGDFEAGLLGAALGGTIGAMTLGVGLLGRWLTDKRPSAEEKGGADPAGPPKNSGR
jgi:hypothetical protein